MKPSDLKIGTSIRVPAWSDLRLPAGTWLVLIIYGNDVLLTKIGSKKKNEKYPGLGYAAWRQRKNIIKEF